MSYFLRRLSLSRLLLLCAVVLVVGVGASALALALGGGPTPPPKPLPEAIHDALTTAHAQPIEGVSARIQLTDHLLEGANLAGAGGGGEAGQLASNPLVTGASGRLWISKAGDVRMELQSEKGATQLIYDGHTVSLYDGSSNTVYRYTPPPQGAGAVQGREAGGSGAGGGGEGGSSTNGSSEGGSGASGSSASGSSGSEGGSGDRHEVPSVAKIEEAITHVSQHATLSGATPTDVAGQPAYTVRISPSHNGGLIGGAELSWDAVHGVPLRVALYSSTSSTPVIELAVTEISYEPVPASVFEIAPPPGAKVKEVTAPTKEGEGASSSSSSASSSASNTPSDQSPHGGGNSPKVTTHGEGLEAIALIESPLEEGNQSSPALPAELPKVQLDGATATELPTPLGTLLSFERSGTRYLLAGAVTPATIEAFARGL